MPPPEAPEKKHFDTSNSDDIKEAFHLVSQTIKELNEKLDKIAMGMKPQAPHTKHHDTVNPNDIKKSFLLFSKTIRELDEQLDKFASAFSRLGHVTTLLSAIEEVRDCLRQTRDAFYHNAVALVPELRDPAHTEARESETSPKSLPEVLKKRAKSFRLLHIRTEKFPEFTEQGSRLINLLSSLKDLLLYRASCAGDHANRLNTPEIQHYIHKFIYDLQPDFEKVAAALSDFTTIVIPAIGNGQARASKTLANILAAATLFSGVTATTLQMSTALPNQNNTILVVNSLWFTSLTLSVGAALNCVLYGTIVYLSDRIKPWFSSNLDPGKHPSWITWWMKGSHIFLLGASILTFSAGLSVFTFSSNQAIYTPYLIIASMALASAGLGGILIWILYLMVKWQASVISRLFLSRITAYIKNLLPWSQRPLGDVESRMPKYDDPKESSSRGGDLADQSNAGPDEINSSAALSELILPDEALVPETIEFKCHGSIRDIEYSDDGKWLAVFCAKEESRESWTTVLDAKTLESFRETYHTKSGVFGALEWSPSGKKLIVKLGSRFNVWDLASDTIQAIDLEGFKPDSDVTWFDEDAFLVAGYFTVFKMDLTGGLTGLYKFEDTSIDSMCIERERNCLMLSTHVLKLREEIKFVDSERLEKRIIIYDMKKRQIIYQVPFLEEIFDTYPVQGTLDILITHGDHKYFQLWSLDPRSKEMLKKRTVTSCDNVNPRDYDGFACIGGNHHQFVFNMKKSGDIDIWRRESGMHYRTFSSSILQKEGVGCFSWRRSDDETATFVTAGNEGRVLRIWRGKQVPAKTSDSPNLAMNEESRDPSQQAVDEAVTSSSASSVPPGAKEVEEGNILKVDPPNGPEAGPSTSNS